MNELGTTTTIKSYRHNSKVLSCLLLIKSAYSLNDLKTLCDLNQREAKLIVVSGNIAYYDKYSTSECLFIYVLMVWSMV